MESLQVTELQMQGKQSGCRLQYLHTLKKAITELDKLNVVDPTACTQRVEYLLEGDRSICPPGTYELSLSDLGGLFLIVVGLNQSDMVDSESLLN